MALLLAACAPHGVDEACCFTNKIRPFQQENKSLLFVVCHGLPDIEVTAKRK
jgi:hypothetical protein